MPLIIPFIMCSLQKSNLYLYLFFFMCHRHHGSAHEKEDSKFWLCCFFLTLKIILHLAKSQLSQAQSPLWRGFPNTTPLNFANPSTDLESADSADSEYVFVFVFALIFEIPISRQLFPSFLALFAPKLAWVTVERSKSVITKWRAALLGGILKSF